MAATGRLVRIKAKMHTAKTTQEWLQDRSLNVLKWPGQSLDLNLTEHLWSDLKIAVQQRSSSHLTELERICREEWGKFPKFPLMKPKVLHQSTE